MTEDELQKKREECLLRIEKESSKEFVNYMFLGLSVDGYCSIGWDIGTDENGKCSNAGRQIIVQLIGEMEAVKLDMLKFIAESDEE